MSFFAWQTLGCFSEAPQRKVSTPAAAPIVEKKPVKKPPKEKEPADQPSEVPELPPGPERPPTFGGSGG
jgi:hypothetical protein